MKYIKVTLGGVDVTNYLKKAVRTSTYGDSVSIYEFEFAKSVNDAVTMSNALAVLVYLDDANPPTTCVFNGYLDKYEPDKGSIRALAKDQLALLINKEITHVYDKSVPGDPANPDGKLSDIFKDIVETYGGLSTNSGATVQDSGTEITLSRFVCNHADPFERCRKLAETLNWCFYYKASDGYVYFEPKNYATNTNTLAVGVNVIEIPTWEYDRSELINDLRVEGAQQLVEQAEVFTGDASETAFTLEYVPISVAVYYHDDKNYATTSKTQEEILIGDVSNSLETHDYEVDAKNKTVTMTSFTPAASANNLLVEYSYYAPIPVHMINDASIATYGTYAKTITLTDVITLEDAWKRAENLLDKYSSPWKTARLKVKWGNSYNLGVGQQISVVDSISEPNVNQLFTIYRVKDYWPEAITDVEVGDKQFTIEEYQTNLLERLKRLEEGTVGSTSAVTEIVQNSPNWSWAPDSMTILTEILNDSFLLGHAVNGVMYAVGETALLDDFETTTGWTASGLTPTLSNDSTAGHFWIGTQGVNLAWTDVSGSGTITKTISSKDLSSVVGVSSGTPSRGTAGLWIYCEDGSDISVIKLKLGNDASNYAEYTATTYKQFAGLEVTFSLDDWRNYVKFDLDVPTTEVGTVDWTAIDYVQITITVVGASNATFDYLTVSKSNDIGMNGLGGRNTTYTTTTYTF